MSLLEVEGFTLSFVQYARGLRRRRLEVITGLDLTADPGELVAVVGASGSGKSLLAHALLGLLPSNAREGGRLTYDGQPLTRERRAALRGRELALIPQSITALDPLTPIVRQAERAAVLAGAADPPARARAALADRQLPEASWSRYPHQLSGGMARRALAAVATMPDARLIVADEPTPGLHPSIVDETLRGLRALADGGAAVVLITHELAGALQIADRIAVFYAGTTVEQAPVEAFAGEGRDLAHPYSRALWQALPRNGLVPLPGGQPSPDALPSGCLFADRCPIVVDECRTARPAPRQVGPSLVRCIRAQS
jgi:peptide/nickel transport system ATP-binding protein